jgi:GTP-binding protein HflX
LDPTVRRARTTDGREYTLTDTVGFVRHLPHQLVEAFRSTLEEVADADLLLHVVDGSDESPEGQLAAVREVLREIGASSVRELVVVNKADAADPFVVNRVLRAEPGAVVVSARTGAGMDELLALIERELPRPAVDVDVLVPYDRGDLVSRVHAHGTVQAEEHTADGTRLVARVDPALAAELARYPSS